MRKILLISLLLLTPSVALAQEGPSSGEECPDDAKLMFSEDFEICCYYPPDHPITPNQLLCGDTAPGLGDFDGGVPDNGADNDGTGGDDFPSGND